ncbi:DUF2165 family protein [Gilliamella sp. CG13]|uniref:DUF2165 family protein n=1 Tax=Gilliamella sp. CG13 TaxID=3351502 RepID=UPI0039875151
MDNKVNLKPVPYTNLSKVIYLYGFAMWMTIITFNNIIDSGTNTLFIEQMISMSNFNPDSVIGSGLLWKAIPLNYASPIASFILWFVVIVEIIIDVLMWRAFFKVLKLTIQKKQLDENCIACVNLALCSFMGIFVLFITGGIWFGYWMHQGQFQLAHLISIIISLLGLIYFNQNRSSISNK